MSTQTKSKLSELSAAASTGKLYATNSRHIDDGDNPSLGYDLEDEVWGRDCTVSLSPDYSGWNTDSGCPGYGISKENAEFIAELWNAYRDGRLVEAE